MKKRIIILVLITFAFCLTPHLANARYLNTATGRFMTMDTYEGDNKDPVSLHKYLFAENNPVNMRDLNGNDVEANVNASDNFDVKLDYILGSLSSYTTPGSIYNQGTPGPDITIALRNTMENIEYTFTNASVSEQSAIANKIYSWNDAWGLWDIDKLAGLGFGDPEKFGNASSLGTGSGALTVQFSTSGLKVYYGGSVNFALWGEMFHLLNMYVGHSVKFNLRTAQAGVFLDKSKNMVFGHGNIFDSYTAEAHAFTKFGYDGTDPSKTALSLITPNPSNVASPGVLGWHFGPLWVHASQ